LSQFEGVLPPPPQDSETIGGSINVVHEHSIATFKAFSNGTDSSDDSMVSFIALYASIGIAME
jgi:hypothetical protein